MKEFKYLPKLPCEWNGILNNNDVLNTLIHIDSYLYQHSSEVIYPPKDLIFKALELTSPANLKIVIIGQDPYHGAGEAMGLAFSVPTGTKTPPSLKNIFKEISTDTLCPPPQNTDLTQWAQQGVLLLNAILTVQHNKALSHKSIGWEVVTDGIIKWINANCNGIIFMLWGKYAQSKKAFINPQQHYILEAAHPSPLARGAFFGCNHFLKANEILTTLNKQSINWNL